MEELVISEVKGFLRNGQAFNGKKVTVTEPKIGFGISLSKYHKKSLQTIVKQYNRRTKHETKIAWSGISVIDEKDTSVQNLPESFAGTPLGFVMNDGVVVNPPLTDKPALIMTVDGNLEIRQINTEKGIKLICRSHKYDLNPDARNADHEKGYIPDFSFYDSCYENDYVFGNGRVIINMGGNLIKEVIFSKKGQFVPLRNTGLTLSIADEAFPPTQCH